MTDPRREFAAEVARTLRAAGFRALFAGGCVRDVLLGEVPSDYDVATEAPPEAVIRLFRRTVPVGVSFGVVRVLGPRAAGEVEVATFRSDGAYVDGRRPEGVTFGNALDDASRRDFTINGMFLDPASGEVIDYVGGRADLESRLVRAIGDPRERFAEDKLRLLRAVRFAARLGFAIEPKTAEAVAAMAPQVVRVSVERIAQEWEKMLIHPSRARAFATARELGLVAAILPEWAAMDRGDRAGSEAALGLLEGRPGFPLAMAALLHPLDPRAVDALARRWKLSNDDRERTAWLVANRSALLDPSAMRRSALKTILARPEADDLLVLHCAIAGAAGRDAGHVGYCESYRRDLPDGPLDPPPLVTGRGLIAAGLSPGPAFAAILARVREAQLEGAIWTEEEALALAREEARRP